MTWRKSRCLGFALLAALSACRQAPSPAPGNADAPAASSPATKANAAPTPAWQPMLPALVAADVPHSLSQARKALDGGRLERGSAPGPGAIELYLAVLAIAPDNADAQRGLRDAFDAMFERGSIALRTGDVATALRVEAMALRAVPAHADLPPFRQRILAVKRAQELLQGGEEAARQGRLLMPAGGSAFDFFRRARLAAPDFLPVEQAQARWHEHLLQRAWKAASDENYALAENRLADARRWSPQSPRNGLMALRILELRQALTSALLQQGHAAAGKLDIAQAEVSFAHASKVAAQPAGLIALRRHIELVRHYGPFEPGQVFSDRLATGAAGPELVVIPHGGFRMGSPEGEAHRQAHEGPAHEVRFARGFALARREISVGEFRRFVGASGYRTLAERGGRSRVFDDKGGQMVERAGIDWRHDALGNKAAAEQPVLHVAFADAEAYAAWLSRQTGQRYRLPSEAEFEYALRAGSESTYPWGDAAPRGLIGNLAGEGDQRRGRRWGNAVPAYRDGFWGTAPGGQFPREGFGSFDLIGNVAEWTLDCWHDSYQRAPGDGSAWVNPGCAQRVLRGAAWDSALAQARSAYRSAGQGDSGSARVGFRVVREL
jgi:formylglycine-generating enzyme required for sulfatase activity